MQLRKPNQDYVMKFVRTEQERELVLATFENKLATITKDEANALIELIGKWGYCVGVSNKLAAEDILLICKYLKDEFSSMTLSEIKLAMNLSLKGDIEVRFYGQLSVMYITMVLKAYRDYKVSQLKDLFERKERHQDVDDNPKLSKKESYDILIHALKEEYNKYVNTNSVDDHFSMIFKHMKKIGVIRINDDLTARAIEYAYKMIEERRIKEATTFGDLLRKSYDHDTLKRKYCRNYCVQELFKNESLDSLVAIVDIDRID